MKTSILKQLTTSIILLFSTMLSAQTINLDPSFDIGTGFHLTGGVTPAVNVIALQSDGKILVCGYFSAYNGIDRNRIARLNTDGSLDTTFNTTGAGLNDAVYTMTLQPDGKILVGGLFTEYNGTTRNRILRLNANGSLDTSFTIGTGFNNIVRTIALQPDGKILAAGWFTSYNGTTQNRIARLHPNGSLDTTFDIGTGFYSPVDEIALQPDGKILVIGFFIEYNGTTHNYVARLNANGSLDTTFNIGTGFNDLVSSIAVQPGGKILAGGFFTEYNGTTQNRIVRLNVNGSLDTTFTIGTGFNDAVFSIAVQSDEKILAGGWFTSYNGTTRNRIACLLNYEQCPSGDVELLSQADVDAFGANYPDCEYIQGNLYIGSIQVPDSDITDLTPLSNLRGAAGIYIRYNPELTSLSGLDDFLYAGSIVISNNLLLTDITPLQNMDLANLVGLDIINNPLLAFCHLPNICTYLQGANPRDIHGNSGNCIDEPAVINACDGLSVSDLDFSGFHFYPNPVTDVVNISSSIMQIQEIQIYDITGKLVQSYNQTGTNITLNVSALQSGLYLAKVKTEEGWFSQKLVKK